LFKKYIFIIRIIAPNNTKYFVNFCASIFSFQRAEERNQSMYDVFIVLPAKTSRDVEATSSIMESSLAQRIQCRCHCGAPIHSSLALTCTVSYRYLAVPWSE
jgi:hypothetical protein